MIKANIQLANLRFMTAIESYGVRSQAAEKLAVANMRLWSFTISKSSNILLKCDFLKKQMKIH